MTQSNIHIRRLKLKTLKTEVTQWKNQDVQKENKTCQTEKVICSQGSQQKDIQLDKPAVLIWHNMLKKQEDDKNCQFIKNVKSKYDDLDSQSTVLKCSDKKCQATKYYKETDKNCQTSVMWSVTKKSDMQLPKPAVPYEYRRKCKDKYCQATMSHKKQKKCEYNNPKVKFQGILARTVKKMKIMICGQ